MENYFNDLIINNDTNFYIGTGNPSSKILIIGKESAIDKISNYEQYEREILNNALDWKKNIEDNIHQDSVTSWFIDYPLYNPLYPYKGQLNKIENKRTGNNGGTSRTFYNYQKLLDKIYNENRKSSNINFHEKCFITELNSSTAKYSHLVNTIDCKDSINNRQELLTHPYYQSFPIVLFAVGNYVRDFNIDIQKLFNVKFDAETGTLPITKTNYINLHYDDITNPSRLVIHTNQLSINISDLLLNELSQYIRKHLELI